jgi:hypothetical protein
MRTHPYNSPEPAACRNRKSGSALIVSIIFTTIITIGVAGLLPMLLSEWKTNSRSSSMEAAFSLAESGVDEAIWAVLEFDEEDQSWIDAGWTESDDQLYWYREWNLADFSVALGDIYTLDEGREGKYRVIVEKVDGSIINIVSQGIVEGGANVSTNFTAVRYIETQFKRPNPFDYGLIARDGLNFNGKPFFDSYDSRVFPYDYLYGANSGSNATVGSVSLDTATLDLGNSTIKGDLATGASDDGTDPSGGASITGDIIWDFEMDFPEIVAPSTTGWLNSI